MENTIIFQQGGYPAVAIAAAVIIVLTAVVSQTFIFLLRRILNRTTNGEVGGSIITNILRVVMWMLGISILLNVCFGFDVAVLLGALGIGGIALSLGLQNTISNLIGGFQISLSRDVKIGDWVSIGTMSGEVIDITWRVMKVHDTLGRSHIIPNSMLNTTALTVMPEWQRVALPLVFSREADLEDIIEKLPQIAFETMGERDLRHGDMMPLLAVEGTSVDSINASLIVYAHRRCTVSEIDDAIMPPVVAYLRSINALAICGA